MARPSSLSTFGDLSAPEVAAMQAGAPRPEPRNETPPPLPPSAPQPEWTFPPQPEWTFQAQPGWTYQAQPQWIAQGQPWWIFQAPSPFVFQAQSQQPHHQHHTQRRAAQQGSQSPTALYPRQRPPSQRPPTPVQTDWQQGIVRPFPVKEAYIQAVFDSLLKKPEFQLPEPGEPDRVGRDINPHYCPYHQMWSHELEDCDDFRVWLERGVAEGLVVLPAAYLVDPPAGSTRFVVSPPDSPTSSSDYSVDPTEGPMHGWIQ